MVTPPNQTKHIVLAEDNLADVALARMAVKSSGLIYDLRVLDDGEKAVTFTLAEYMQVGIIVRDLLCADDTSAALPAGSGVGR